MVANGDKSSKFEFLHGIGFLKNYVNQSFGGIPESGEARTIAPGGNAAPARVAVGPGPGAPGGKEIVVTMAWVMAMVRN